MDRRRIAYDNTRLESTKKSRRRMHPSFARAEQVDGARSAEAHAAGTPRPEGRAPDGAALSASWDRSARQPGSGLSAV